MNTQSLAIIEKYEGFLNYIYPILIGTPRCHYVVRDMVLRDVLEQPRLFIEAAKSNQISKIYAADAGLATLRAHLRFLAHPGRKIITTRQHEVAAVHLAEVGKMLGAWMHGRNCAKGG